MKDLIKKAESAIHDLLVEIYARDGYFNDQTKEIHDLLIELKRNNKNA